MLRLVPRQTGSTWMLWSAPVLAVILTVMAGGLMFLSLDVDPVAALGHILLDPFSSTYARAELLVKSAPLALIGLGLSLGFRAGVWNIGAEGQFTLGALGGGVVALAFWNVEGAWLFPLICLGGIASGMAWAAIPAYLKVRHNTNEILVSLMLTYIAVLLISALVSGPLRDPEGYNFPESRMFHASAVAPILIEGTRAHIGIALAPLIAVILWGVLMRHEIGYGVRLFGDAPKAARFAGFTEKGTVWFCLLLSGGLAGLAGALEATGPLGQLVPDLPAGYGFTAIIVAFLGRLTPLGVLVGAFALGVTYIGGESAQVAMSLPAAVVGVFQGMLLFFLLSIDVLVTNRVQWVVPAAAKIKAGP
jgi:ABC-type uncharacterized transport system permease subunit